ncbi:MAG: TIGR02301 family protein [Hyphomicrobium sp.]|nr:TIGR02301 family protein [Hyphomicrobium sp.]
MRAAFPTDPERQSPSSRRIAQPHVVAALLMSFAAGLAAEPGHAASDLKPYDDKLMRLSEILGAVHYLRELCGANEGQYWRERMRDLAEAEGSTALRRAKLARAFNQGYRSYSRTYNTCSPSAQTAITRFLTEGTELSEAMVKAYP